MDLPPQDLANYEIVIRVDGSVDRRRYNAPTSSEAMVIVIHETSGCGLGAGGYGGLVMPTVLITFCILSCSTHTENSAGTQILLALPLRLWMG
ncbi:unnamed protein product [Sphagnum balticum]